MCGIVGALSFKGSRFSISERYITAMRETMTHRGPDGAGTWVSDDCRVGLGHRRLSIIDLSDCAAQPMGNEDGSLWVVFNGEIYNHAELRAELVALGGHRWKTDHSDTEVILHGFEQWGIDCVQKFRGMFAIALWDARTRQLWLIRDRIGIKPLCYSIHHGRVTFASEIKALLRDPDQKRAVNEESFYHYLSFLATPAPDTLFQGIHKLAAGTWLRITEDGSVQQRRYWDVWDHTQPLLDVPEEEITERLLAELRTAVKLRKVSDVPVGVFLSGGIDSSTNAALFSEAETSAVKTFSIGYKGEYRSYKSELHYARRMAEEVNAEYSERILEEGDLLDFLPEMIRLQDEPIADFVCVPVYYVSKLARDRGVIVCQVGEGSDELFWGYRHWKTLLRLQQCSDLPVPLKFKQIVLGALKLVGAERTRPYEYLRRAVLEQPVFWGGAEAFTETQKRRLLSPRLRHKFSDLSSWQVLQPIRERFESKAWQKSALHWMTYLDLNFRLPELLLMRVDKMAMGVGVEGRVPFLDHKFVELALSIPQAVKTRRGVSKYILKKAVRGLIPDELIDRKKQGFSLPHEWFGMGVGTYAARELADFCEHTDYFDREQVSRILKRGSASGSWCLLNFALWWREYIADTPRVERFPVSTRSIPSFREQAR
ncbi:MAG TPA: asparagine synthase (glutamine-hydrolyzing) [Terriglobales bacterium]|nr:asparagine synthase (glutamine-hydrolyzing) [Terriglobales bacterium]